MQIPDEKIDRLIETIETLRGAVKVLNDEVRAMRETLSNPSKPLTTGLLEVFKAEHDKLHPKK